MVDQAQALQALHLANTVRTNGAAVIREVRAGTLALAEALDDPRAQALPIGRLLLAQPRWGQQKAGRLLKRLSIWPQRRVRDLTDRQRRVLCVSLSMPGSDSHNPPAFDRRFTDRYVSLDAVVRFLCEDGKWVAAAKVATEFGSREALEAGER